MALSVWQRFNLKRHSGRAAAGTSVDATTPLLPADSTGTSKLEPSKSEPLSETPKSCSSESIPAVLLESSFNSSLEKESLIVHSDQIYGGLEGSCAVCRELESTTGKDQSAKRDDRRALQKLNASLRGEVGRLKAELAAARVRGDEAAAASRLEVEGKLREAKRENAEKASDIENFRERLAKLDRKCAEEERNVEEKASRIAELEKELTQAREAGARRADARERFEYVLECSGQVGSVPRNILASAPESVLFKTFCGEWEYARDQDGRALITCHPKRWAAILEHLFDWRGSGGTGSAAAGAGAVLEPEPAGGRPLRLGFRE